MLAAAVCPARTRLTSHPVPATRKGGRPGAVGAGAPEHIGPSATPATTWTRHHRGRHGATQSVTSLGPPLNR